MTEQTVVVNGKVYDRRTGMPLRHERGRIVPADHSATTVHATPQKSRTLHRKYVHLEKTPTHHENDSASAVITVHKKPHASTASTAHPAVKRFVKDTPHTRPTPIVTDIAPAPHHLAKKAEVRTTKPVVTGIKPSHVLKREAIDQATAAMPTHRAEPAKQPHLSHTSRALSVASAALALLLLGGYFTYLNMPALSTRVAAAQAGINATYPGYQPSGYSLSGPVAFQQGNVTMKFAANAGPQSYTLSQTKSGWDSSAVLDNYVTPKVGDDYMANSINGLTIYTYGNNAAWVNDGILYSINGNAPLSSDQIEHIATSM